MELLTAVISRLIVIQLRLTWIRNMHHMFIMQPSTLLSYRGTGAGEVKAGTVTKQQILERVSCLLDGFPEE